MELKTFSFCNAMRDEYKKARPLTEMGGLLITNVLPKNFYYTFNDDLVQTVLANELSLGLIALGDIDPTMGEKYKVLHSPLFLSTSLIRR